MCKKEIMQNAIKGRALVFLSKRYLENYFFIIEKRMKNISNAKNK
jgi:hypothetical protein